MGSAHRQTASGGSKTGPGPAKSIHTRAYAPCAPFEPLGFPSRDRPCHHALSQLTHIDNLVYHVVLSFVFCLIPFPACIAGGGLSRILIFHFLVCPGTLCDHGRQTKDTQSPSKCICQIISICTIFADSIYRVDSNKVAVVSALCFLVCLPSLGGENRQT